MYCLIYNRSMLRKQLTILSQLLTYYQSKQIPLSHALFARTVKDTHLYHQFIPHCSQSHIVTQLSPQQNYTRLAISFGNFKEISYLSHVVIEEGEGRTKVTSVCKDDPLKYLKSVWTIEEKGINSSQVTYEIDFEFQSMLYQLASSAFMSVMGKAMWDVFLIRATQMAQQKAQNVLISSPISISPQFIQESTQPQNQIQNLASFLAEHPQIAYLYQNNLKIRSSINALATRLQGRSDFSRKLQFEIKNLLTH